MIPAVDSAGRPTLRRGDTGDLVKTIQMKEVPPVTGTFDAVTEAAVRHFQRSTTDWCRTASLAREHGPHSRPRRPSQRFRFLPAGSD